VRILFFTWPARLQRFVEVVAELSNAGHEIVVATPRQRAAELPRPLQGLPNVRVEAYDEVSDPARGQGTALLRLARDYVWHATAPVPHGTFNRRRALDFLLKALSRDGRAGGDRFSADPALSLDDAELATLRDALAGLERSLPPDPSVLRLVRHHLPDAVLVTPLILAGSHQVEAVKAARVLSVPSGFLVYSWDNLSNKGLIHVAPDRVYVWNELQRSEAATLHGIDVETVIATGAPRWDAFFAMRPSVTRGQLCAAYGFDPDRPIVLYLGSSSAVVPDETLVIERWLAAVRSADPPLCDANVLVRPHPREVEMWSGWIADRQRVARSRHPRQADQSLYDELYHSTAVVGLNTSAQIEASILGKPVLTFLAGDLAPGQQGSLHFYYLLEEQGGAVAYAETLGEHVEQLRGTLAGGYDSEAIRRFCESFVRPRGLDRPASPILAAEIVELARSGRRLPRLTAPLRRLARAVG
jgi:hypothetical protein